MPGSAERPAGERPNQPAATNRPNPPNAPAANPGDAAQTIASAVGAGSTWLPVTLIYVCELVALHEVGALALAFYGGYGLERRYGLSTQTLGDWLSDQAKALALTIVILGTLVGFLVYAIYSPIFNLGDALLTKKH